MSLPSSAAAMPTRTAVAVNLARKSQEVGTLRAGLRLSIMYSSGDNSHKSPHGTNTTWKEKVYTFSTNRSSVSLKSHSELTQDGLVKARREVGVLRVPGQVAVPHVGHAVGGPRRRDGRRRLSHRHLSQVQRSQRDAYFDHISSSLISFWKLLRVVSREVGAAMLVNTVEIV